MYENREETRNRRRLQESFCVNRQVRYDASAMTTDRMDFAIKTESRGAHWIAWVTRGASDTPLDSVILVGQTRDEAESKARTWADKLAADLVLIRS